MIVGGGSPRNTNTETWNGASWTEVNEMNLARYAMGTLEPQLPHYLQLEIKVHPHHR